MVEQMEKNPFLVFLGKHLGTSEVTVAEAMNFKAEEDK